MTELTFDEVRTFVKADPDAGVLFWEPRPKRFFATYGEWKRWNTRYAHLPAFTTHHSKGYLIGRIYRRIYMAHRVVWLLALKRWPTDQIDHINGDYADNRLANLREVSTAENARNQKMKSNNTSGVTGVCWSKRRDCWTAYIGVDGTNHTILYSESFEKAVLARKAAQLQYGFHPNHGRAA